MFVLSSCSCCGAVRLFRAMATQLVNKLLYGNRCICDLHVFYKALEPRIFHNRSVSLQPSFRRVQKSI